MNSSLYLGWSILWESRTQSEVNFGHQGSIGDIEADESVFVAAADRGGEDGSVVGRRPPSELVSQGEGLAEVHGPPVLGDGSDDRHSLFHWVDSECGVVVGLGVLHGFVPVDGGVSGWPWR